MASTNYPSNDYWRASMEEPLDRYSSTSGSSTSQFDSSLYQDIPEVKDFFKKVMDKKWLSGGRREHWEEITKLAMEWRDASKPFFTENIPSTIERIIHLENILTTLNFSQFKFTYDSLYFSDSLYFRNSLPNFDSSNLISKETAESTAGAKRVATRSVQLVVLMKAKEIKEKKDGVAKLEYDVLDIGGWIMGFDKAKLYVYYPFASEVIAERLKALSKNAHPTKNK